MARFRRVLLVTTRSAYGLVLGIVGGLRKDYEIDVIPSGAPVAHLATCEDIARELRERLGRCSYDLVLVPGLVRGSTRVIEEAIGCRVYKGTRYAGDIPLLLELLEGGAELSKETPADEVYSEAFSSGLLSLYDAEVSRKEPLFEIGGVGVYLDPPPLGLLLEVRVEDPELERKVGRAARAGFEGVVVGCGSRCDPELLVRTIGRVRELVGAGIVGIDVPRPSELAGDVLELADAVFNVALPDVDRVAGRLGGDKGVVAIPSTVDSVEEALRSLEEAVSRLEEVGLRKVVVDPLARPPGLGFAESIVRFYSSRRRLRHPHLFGTANVYEMIDADSHGVVALLLSTAMELGASLALATEESNKTRGAVEEHAIARYMAYVSHLKRSPPKDAPGEVDLLLLKGKRPGSPPPPAPGVPLRRVGALEHRPDPRYYVRVYADHAGGELVVDVLRTESGEVLARFAGGDPGSLARALLREFELTPEHAAYLGYELGKAELALRFRREYVQDSPAVVSPAERIARSGGVLSSLVRKSLITQKAESRG